MASSLPKSWMLYEVPLTQELQLETAIREVAAHEDKEKIRDLCTSLMRQNFHQEQLLRNAIHHISQLELVMVLGATAAPDEVDVFMEMAREVSADLGLT